MRTALDKHNRAEVAAGVRRRTAGRRRRRGGLQAAASPGRGLAMMVGHMDGLARALSILHIEGEGAVQVADGRLDGGRLAAHT
jgi:hypothetical protein